MPVQVENEANAAALGEFHYGAASGIKDMIYIAAGYGLGSGIIVDGKLLRGNRGYAAEVGHMTIDPNGQLCNCGKKGCYETIISPRAVIDRVNKIIKEEGGDSRYLNKTENGFGYDTVVDAASHHDQVALEALENVGRDLGLLVSNLVNIFNPKMVILGGALNYAKDYIQPVVLDIVKANALQLCQEELIITKSELDPFSAVMGMISLVNEKSFSEW
jgi:predicted NBD/HSP70 family sugar kinase